jgi:hypothetical protein
MRAACIRSAIVAAFASTAVAQVPGSLDPVAKSHDQRLLLLKAAEFDPLAATPVLPEGLAWGRDDAAPNDYFIVQLLSRIVARDHDDLQALGAEEIEYLPQNAFVVRAPGAAIAGLLSWHRTRAIVPFEPAYRVDAQLLARANADRSATLDVVIALFPGCDTADATLRIREAGVDLFEPDVGTSETLLARLPADRLEALARVRDVQWIQPQPVASYRNNVTAWVIQSNVNGSTPIWNNNVKGENEIIGHIDGPIYMDSCFFDDPAVSSPGPTHRKVVSHHGSYASPDAHGTHTAGTCAGDKEPINGSTINNGMAYHARIAHTNLSLITGTNLKTKLDELYGDGARIFTNSWGDDTTNAYNTWSKEIDQFVWDNEEALVCWAVSNSSVITNPENAKNLLACSGALQSPNQDSHCTGGTGPTTDGRRKPEIMAPGCGINSADFNASCGVASMSGTSMATPAIAGGGAMVRQYFEEGYYPTGTATPSDGFTPSAALLKALLLDSSVNMTGITGFPSDLEGWGRLNLDRCLYFAGDLRRLWVADIDGANGFNSSGESHTWYVRNNGNGIVMEFCLAFTDKYGNVNSSQPVVNDLDLELVDPNGTVYLGNVWSGGSSTTGGTPDALNNVERARFTAPPVGWWTIHVNASSVTTTRNQSYALVVNGDIDPPLAGTFVTYGAGTKGTGNLIPVCSGTGSPQVGDDITVTISNGVGSASALLLVGNGRAAMPYHGGWLLVAQPWVQIPLMLSGPPGVAGAGTASSTGTIDDDPALIGVKFDFQGIVFDKAALKGTALSNGLEMTIGS